MEDKFEIRHSSIPQAGMGIFAKEPISANQRIGHYQGELKTSEQFEKMRDTTYTFEISKKVANRYKLFYIDAKNKRKSNFLRYINGAKTSSQRRKINTTAYQYKEKIFYKTTKAVKAGEELIIDYGDSYWLD